jgi:hypothetical protein
MQPPALREREGGRLEAVKDSGRVPLVATEKKREQTRGEDAAENGNMRRATRARE